MQFGLDYHCHAKSGEMESVMDMRVNEAGDRYYSKTKFSRNSTGDDEKECSVDVELYLTSVEAHFRRLMGSHEGIENMLADPLTHKLDCRDSHDVMICVVHMEDQMKRHIKKCGD